MKSFLTVKGLKTAFRISGSGNPVLLLHGWGCDLQIFDLLQQYLSQKFQVYALDLPGFGDSEEPPADWGTQAYADFVQDFMQLKGLEQPVLLGHSFGGRLSIVLGARLPLRRIILVGSAGIKPKRSLRYYIKVYSYKLMKRLINFPLWAKWTAPLREKYLQKAGSADYRSASETMRRVISKVVNEDLKHLMPQIKASVLLIWGEKDTATPLSDGKQMEKLIPGAGLAVMSGCGHYCFLEKPDLFNRILDAFLKDA